jgi:hypothetical protein
VTQRSEQERLEERERELKRELATLERALEAFTAAFTALDNYRVDHIAALIARIEELERTTTK